MVKRQLLFILFVGLALICTAQQTVKVDTSIIQSRAFNQQALHSLQKQKAFQYQQQTGQITSLWARFWAWFWWKIEQLMRTRQGKATVWSLLILFGIGMIVYFITRVLGMNKAGLFGRNSGKGLAYTTSSEDINNISFDEVIAGAISNRNYRLAVRLLYLQVLKKMSDKGFIQWQINKTNTDYIAEVSIREWSETFKQLTTSFEYTWYGEAMIGAATFNSLQQQFVQFNDQLK